MKTSAGLVNKVDLSGRGYALFSSFFIACQKELYDKCNVIATACGRGGGVQPAALKTQTWRENRKVDCQKEENANCTYKFYPGAQLCILVIERHNYCGTSCIDAASSRGYIF